MSAVAIRELADVVLRATTRLCSVRCRIWESAWPRQVSVHHMTSEQGWAALGTWRQLAVTRYAVHTLLGRV